MIVIVRHPDTSDTFVEFDETPPACSDCDHRTYKRGSWCMRPSTIKVFNVITGEYDLYAGPTRCQSQRYGVHESCCGIKGKFFKAKQSV